MKQIPIGEATPDQVRNFALMVGCDLSPNDSPETVTAKLKLVWQGATITAADTPADNIGALGGDLRTAPEDRQPGESSPFAAVARAERVVGSTGKNDPRVILQVQRPRFGNDVSKAQDYVTVAVNGVGFQIKSGQPVDVPYRVWEALNNAMRVEITHDDEGEVVETSVHAYPFNVLERPSAREVEAWHQATDHVEMA